MNTKKVIILLTILVLLFGGGYMAYQKLIYYYPPSGTGAAPSMPDNQEVLLGSSINKLLKSLPLEFEGFKIERYDYSKAKFIVFLNGQTSTEPEDFYSWLQNSEFNVVPNTMFEIHISN